MLFFYTVMRTIAKTRAVTMAMENGMTSTAKGGNLLMLTKNHKTHFDGTFVTVIPLRDLQNFDTHVSSHLAVQM